jgi:hypothetical protein
MLATAMGDGENVHSVDVAGHGTVVARGTIFV